MQHHQGLFWLNILWPPELFSLSSRSTPSYGTSLTTTPVYGPGPVSKTPGQPLTQSGFLKGILVALKFHLVIRLLLYFTVFPPSYLFSFYITFVYSFRAAEKGNFEAAVKLGIAYLYNEGRKWNTSHLWFVHRYWMEMTTLMHQMIRSLLVLFPLHNNHFLYFLRPSAMLTDEARADVCGRKASRFFSLAESLRSPTADPFVWVFIRPPWSPTGSCCKAVVFDRLKAECDTNVVSVVYAGRL